MQYPEIRALSQDDALFVQQQSALEEFRKLSQVSGRRGFPTGGHLRVPETGSG